MLPWLVISAVALATAAAPTPGQQPDTPTNPPAANVAEPPRLQLARALREYFADADARGPRLAAVRKLAAGHEELLIELLRRKAFVAPCTGVARVGVIDRSYAFVDDEAAANPALLFGPDCGTELRPLIVYVPDTTDSAPFKAQVRREGAERGYFVLLVPDEARDNLWRASRHETARHTGPLRDLLLRYPIDPDRLWLVGSGRGGHAAWDIGLMRSELWAGIYPCNGGLIHEGGYKATGGVFVENGKDLTIFTVYNTTFDHGIDSCRYAARLLRQWHCRFEAVEEPRMRVMGLAEATEKLVTVTRRAHPRTLTKRFNHTADGSHYWLQALDRRPKVWDPSAPITVSGAWPAEPQQQLEAVWAQVQKDCAWLHGSVAGNTMRIGAQGTGRLRVWLDPDLIDFAARLTITVNDKPKPALQPTLELDVMLARVHETGDTSRLYQDYVDLTVPR